MKNHRIVIIGFMGSGKTKIAQELALALKDDWIDLDALIEETEKRSPAEIIRQDSEARFRQIETEMLRRVLTAMEERVIALGGGAWMAPANRKLIADSDSLAIWLDTPFELCWERIAAAEVERPLAPTRQAAEQLYKERSPTYGLANIRIPVSAGESTQDTVRRIAAALEHQAQT
jgi:shikimate kinase